MKLVVKKFELTPSGITNIQVPFGSKILKVVSSGNKLLVFALIDEVVAKIQNVKFAVVPTGTYFNNNQQECLDNYLDSVLHGPFVYHIFYSLGTTI
jgi:hypothetical protein